MSCLAYLLLPLATCLGQVDDTETKPTPEAIARAIGDLGADRFSDRERASQVLWLAGRAAEPALRKAAESDDAEVAQRAEKILKKFRLGIYPDTPVELADRIQRYSSAANQNFKLAVVKELLDIKRAESAVKLINNDRNESHRTWLVGQFAAEVTSRAKQRILTGDFDDAEALLRAGALTNHDAAIRDYALLLHLTGKLPENVEEWAKAERQDRESPGALDIMSDETRARLLFRGLRFAGKLAEAADVAKRHELRDLQLEAAYHASDWKTAAEIHNRTPPGAGPSTAYLQWAGFAATYDHLAGNDEEYNKRIEEIIKLGKENKPVYYYALEALLINERFDEALDVAKSAETVYAVRLLADRRQFREAFALAGWKDLKRPSDEEMQSFANTAQSGDRRYIALEVIKQLVQLGRKKDGEAFFDRLITHRPTSSPSNYVVLCDDAVKAGLIDRVDAFAARALEPWNNTKLSVSAVNSLFEKMYPKQGHLAAGWWNYLGTAEAKLAPQQRVELVRQMMVPARGARLGAKRLGEILTAAVGGMPLAAPDPQPKAGAKKPPPPPRRVAPTRTTTADRPWLFVAGETCLRHGRKDLAARAFRKAAQSDTESAIKLGDLLREAGKAKEAAGWYARAVEREPGNRLARYLHGLALEQSGEKEPGRRERLIAELMLISLTSTDRAELSDGLKARKLTDHAIRQWEAGLRMNDYGDWYVGNCAMNLSYAIRESDPRRAAAVHYQYWARKLWTSVRYNVVVAHLRASVAYHRYLGMALLKEGKKKEAVAEFERGIPAIPGYLTNIREIVPALDKHGLREGADRLFDAAYAANERVIRDFPDNAYYRNHLAWASAVCERRLDRALELAQEAIELDPDNVTFSLTLAEVHFRRGHRDKAIEIAKECVMRAPYSESFKKNLKRYEVGRKEFD